MTGWTTRREAGSERKRGGVWCGEEKKKKKQGRVKMVATKKGHVRAKWVPIIS